MTAAADVIERVAKFNMADPSQDDLTVPLAIQSVELFEQIARLKVAMQEACDLLAERTHGNPARSAGHNARLRLEAALSE